MGKLAKHDCPAVERARSYLESALICIRGLPSHPEIRVLCDQVFQAIAIAEKIVRDNE